MHAITWSVFCTANRLCVRPICRRIFIPHRPSLRNFHPSVVSRRVPEDSDVAADSDAKNGTTAKDEENKQPEVEDSDAKTYENKSIDRHSHRRRRRMKRGLAQRRNDKDEDPAEARRQIELPGWFLENNVTLFRHSNGQSGTLALYGIDPDSTTPAAQDNNHPTLLGNISDISGEVESFEKHDQGDGSSNSSNNVYALHQDVYREILASSRAGLILRPPPGLKLRDIWRPDIHILCLKREGYDFLDSIVQRAAFDLGADLLVLDPEDIAQILSDHTGQNIAWTWNGTGLLGYSAQQMAGGLDSSTDEPPKEEYDGEDGEEEEWPVMPKPINRFPTLKSNDVTVSSVHIKLPGFLERLFKSTNSTLYPIASGPLKLGPTADQLSATGSLADSRMDDNISRLLEALIDSVEAKRCSRKTSLSDHSSDSGLRVGGLIIQVNQYNEMSRNYEGNRILQRLKNIVKKRWHNGENVIIMGTSAVDPDHLTQNSIRNFKSDVFNSEQRTILVPPQRSIKQDAIFAKDYILRIRRINIRHLEYMTSQLAAAAGKSLTIDLQRNLLPLPAHAQSLDRHIWSYAWIYRLAINLLGISHPFTSIEGPAFLSTLRALGTGDDIRILWGAEEQKQEYSLDEPGGPLVLNSERGAKDKMQHIKKICTTHEKRLLSGVVNPGDINTTFTDIQAPVETIDALKTLTSLSLIRPESFSYGVLATDKITGVLLYGPPGTGKTLLARAVAKESGATVLEVSAAELHDMYVGEGEKNVKAVFSLAKKLSPCIVFLDEADAILGSRGGESGRRTGHRELINQFLREWDGMKDISTLLMIATNRPFDLDEAILRRLPRKILMDLPLEKDREAILKIHLRDELLDESVSLRDIAKKTPYYSGSDLRNLTVAAALACVREENLAAAQHTGPAPYVHAPKRVLKCVHFDKAMEEISASISEDMSTLSAIRKFDAAYGDRKGRRKTGAGLGFGGTSDPERDSEAGMVRNPSPGSYYLQKHGVI